jgi:serine/threonine-protein kinase
MPHEESRDVCPSTGKPIDRRGPTPLGFTRVPADSRGVGAPALPPRAPAAPPSSSRFEAARKVAPRPPPPRAGTGSYSLPRRDLIGKTIGGKYNVRAVLGEGGMGTVFEALNLAIGRQVAIKVLHATQLRKKDAVRRFHQEARAAGAIGHPNICEVYDLGTLDDGCPYLVMEKLVGETLADRIAREGGLPTDEVVDILTQVLSGLVAAHEKGIVHRDIKPENVFLTRRVGCPPVAKLVDFGVSKIIAAQRVDADDQEMDLTRTGIVLGTPYYLAPEQARGDRNLDARVDLYASGVVLYEALTGRRPFTAANYNALLINILTRSPRPARELRPDLPEAFDQILQKAMAREPFDRYQSAVEFQNDLQRLGLAPRASPSRAPAPLAAEPVPPPPRSRLEDERIERALGSTRRSVAAKRAFAGAGVPPDFTRPPSRPPPPVAVPVPPSSATPVFKPVVPFAAQPAVPRPAPALPNRKVSQGFDDLPTEVQAPEGILIGVAVEEHEPTPAMDDQDVRRIVAAARAGRGRVERAVEPDGATVPPRRAKEGFLVDFRDDSKTEVMNEQLQNELAKASQKPPRPRR